MATVDEDRVCNCLQILIDRQRLELNEHLQTPVREKLTALREDVIKLEISSLKAMKIYVKAAITYRSSPVKAELVELWRVWKGYLQESDQMRVVLQEWEKKWKPQIQEHYRLVTLDSCKKIFTKINNL